MTHDKSSQGGYSLSWHSLKGDWPLWCVFIFMFAASALLYPQLPTQIPSHWNVYGQVDSTMAKPWGAFYQPLLALGLYLGLLLLPLADPKRDNYVRFLGTYRLLRFIMIAFFAVMHVVSLAIALGSPLPMNRIVLGSMGLVFALLGNSLGKIRRNYFVGIKTPWTLANETVWRATHRLAGRLWAAAGVVTVLVALFNVPAGAYIAAVALGAGSVFSIVYSYIVWKKVK